MDTSTRKFTVRRWFSIYLKNKAARSKNSPGFCQLEVSQSTKLSPTEHACLFNNKGPEFNCSGRVVFSLFFFFLKECACAECVMCCASVPEALQRQAA